VLTVLRAKQRERAHERVIAEATAWAICLEEAVTINERGLHECNIDLLARAAHELKVPPDYVLVDGVNRPPDLTFPSEPIVRGDASSASIAAASIIAKVTRDRVMEELHATYPQYGFDQPWVLSPAHMDALSRCGLTPVHRLNKGTKRWLRVPYIDPEPDTQCAPQGISQRRAKAAVAISLPHRPERLRLRRRKPRVSRAFGGWS
jgi:ribonuclease HII